MFETEIKCAIEMKTIIWRLALNSYNLDLILGGWNMKDRVKKGLELFVFFFKIGCFTFGGGWSILAQMEQEAYKIRTS